ncbi:MAG TPA: PTS sugar transporter subunit IIA [Xanthomonadales bacterium]|nr:PTS sugar transporter subunit IIA [Xanthomonadales bacterium]
MQLIDILARDHIGADIRVSSKKRLLEQLAGLLAGDLGASVERAIFEALIAREHLGSTGLGQGVAIPHGRVGGNLPPTAAFMRLKNPIDFDAPDGEPVDLVLALVVPDHFTDQHLSLLAQVAELFSHAEVCEELREARDAGQLFERLSRRTLQFSEV